MRARQLRVLTLVAVLTLLLLPLSFTIQPTRGFASPTARADNVFLVKFRSLPAPAIDALNRQFGAQSLGVIAAIGVHKLRVPTGRTVDEMVTAYRGLADVEFAEPDYLATALDTLPNDPMFAQQWGPGKIQLPAAWDVQVGSAAVVVAVVDTGADASHPDLAGRFAPGYNVFSQGSDTQDDNGHGTHVAGIIGALTNNTTGVAGVTWQVTILPVKVLDATGSGTYSGVATGITYAADHGARVINLSLGGSSPSDTLKAAVDYAWSKGVLLACAAGNTGTAVIYPAAYVPCTAVGATDSNDQKAYFSSIGPGLDVTAPGVSILSTVPMGTCTWCDPSGYRTLSGTSMATPHVAGLAALLFSQFPGATNAQVENQIEAYADDLGTAGWDDNFGYGRINAFRTLTGAFPAPPVPPAPQRPDPLAVVIDAPSSGSTVTGVVTIRVTVSGGVSPYHVQVTLSTKNRVRTLCDTTTTATQVDCTWDARKGGGPGTYSIYALATDASTSASSSVTVTLAK